MPSRDFTTVVAAGGFTPNILAGSAFEFPGVPSIVSISMLQDPGGGQGESFVQFGQEVQQEASPINDSAGAGLGPSVVDDRVVSDIAAPGDRLVIQLRETGGVNPVTVRTKISIQPL